MRATDFEFRHRFWIILAIFTLAFIPYKFDPRIVAEWVVKVLGGPGLDMNSRAARQGIQAVLGLSAALVIAAAWIRTWGGAYLHAEVVFDIEVHSEKLVADGPFRFVRNPLYFGNVLMALGFGLLASRTGFLILVIGQTLFVLRLIGREESALLETQREGYRAYLAAVPRLWPSLVPRVPAGGMRPRWLQALLGEAWMWVFGLDGLLLAWTLSSHLYFRVLWVCLAALVLREIVLRRWRRGKL